MFIARFFDTRASAPTSQSSSGSISELPLIVTNEELYPKDSSVSYVHTSGKNTLHTNKTNAHSVESDDVNDEQSFFLDSLKKLFYKPLQLTENIGSYNTDKLTGISSDCHYIKEMTSDIDTLWDILDETVNVYDNIILQTPKIKSVIDYQDIHSIELQQLCPLDDETLHKELYQFISRLFLDFKDLESYHVLKRVCLPKTDFEKSFKQLLHTIQTEYSVVEKLKNCLITFHLKNVSKLVSNDAQQRLFQWMTAVKHMTVLVGHIGSKLIIDTLQETCESSLSPYILKLQTLLFMRYYTICVRDCLSLLSEAQYYLSTQDIKECLRVLHEFHMYVHTIGTKYHQLIFRGITKHIIKTKLEFILNIIIPLIANSFYQLIDLLDWGSSQFETNCLVHSSSVEMFRQTIFFLYFCGQLYHDYELFNVNYIPDPINHFSIVWVVSCLSSIIVLRFRLLFCCPESPLCRLDFQTQSYSYLKNILNSHFKFLQTLSPSDTFCSFLFSSSQDTIQTITQEIAIGLAHMIAKEINRFVLVTYNALKNELFDIQENSIQENHLIISNSIKKNQSIPINQIIKNLVDQLLRIAETIGTLSPTSVYYLFCPMSIQPYQDILLHTTLELFSPIPVIHTPTESVRDTTTQLNSDPTPQHNDVPMIVCTTPKEQMPHSRRPSHITCLDILCQIDYDRVDTYFNSEIHHLLIPTILYQDLSMTMLSDEKKGRSCRISQLIHGIIEAIQVCDTRLSILTYYSEGVSFYSKNVYEPILIKCRLLLRNTWNSFYHPNDELISSTLILETFQIVSNFLASQSFSGTQYLITEISEWHRLRTDILNVFKNLFVEHMKSYLSQLTTLSGSEFYVSCVKKFENLTHYVYSEPARSQLFNQLGETVVTLVLQYIFQQIHVLYCDETTHLETNCLVIHQCFTSISYFIPTPHLITCLCQLQDVCILLALPVDQTRAILNQLQPLQHFKHITQQHNDISTNQSLITHGKQGFLGVHLMLEAEHLLKKSTQQFLGQTQDAFLNDPLQSLNASEIHQDGNQSYFDNIIHQELQIQSLSAMTCYHILTKRREFCFSTSPGYSIKTSNN